MSCKMGDVELRLGSSAVLGLVFVLGDLAMIIVRTRASFLVAEQ